MFKNWVMLVIVWFPVVAVALLVAMFLWRRLWRSHPFFFIYLVYALLVVPVRYLIFYFAKPWYFHLYWISDLAGALVAFFPMYEIFLKRMFPKFYKTGFYRNIFPLVGLIVLILTVVTALQSHDRSGAFQSASRAFDFMRTSVLVFFIGLAVLMGRTWTRYDLGITLGFAIQAAVALASAAAKLRMHYQRTVFDTAEFIAYNLSCLIWLVTFAQKEKATQTAYPSALETLNEARSWETMLRTWLTPGRGKR